MTKHILSDGEAILLATYLGGTACACGTVATAITPNAGATSAMMTARGAACYYQIGGTAAAISPGYIPQDCKAYIQPIDNLGALSVIGAADGAVFHVEFYDEFQD